MIADKTNWMECGLRQRRAVLSGYSVQAVRAAKEHYNAVTTPSMSVSDRIKRAVHLRKQFNVGIEHEYRFKSKEVAA